MLQGTHSCLPCVGVESGTLPCLVPVCAWIVMSRVFQCFPPVELTVCYNECDEWRRNRVAGKISSLLQVSFML